MSDEKTPTNLDHPTEGAAGPLLVKLQPTVESSLKPNAEQVGDVSETSPSQVERSGGPRTPQGKLNSRKNAIRHGIFAEVLLLKHEPRAKFYSLVSGFHTHFAPVGAFEEYLVEKLASAAWRLRRVVLADANTVNRLASGALLSLDTLMRYETTLERVFERTLSQLERTQGLRLGHPVPPRIDLDVRHSSE